MDTAASSSSWVFPLTLSCLAGASTCVGAAVVFCFEPTTIQNSMAFSLSLAAAVMVTISFVSILPEVFHGILFQEQDNGELAQQQYLDIVLPTTTTTILRTRLLLERLVSLALGVSAYLLLAKLLSFLPDPEHMYLKGSEEDTFDKRKDYDLFLVETDLERQTIPSQDAVRRRGNRITALTNTKVLPPTDVHDFVATTQAERKRSWRVALMLFVSLLIHNFPEGLCVAASAKESPDLGITVAIGIFIHNVPEGIAISVPCLAAKPDQPWLAFWLASFSGLAEPLGAIVALTMLGQTKLDLENVLAFVAGVMTTVAVWELYPEALQAIDTKSIRLRVLLQTEYRPILWGTMVGTALMVATELYLP